VFFQTFFAQCCEIPLIIASLFKRLKVQRIFHFSGIKHLGDEELVANLINGVKLNSSFNELYLRYVHLVFGVCLKYLKQKEDAEDLTNQLFSTLIEKVNKHKIEKFKPWLYRVVKNECLMRLRKKTIQSVDIENLLDLGEESSGDLYKEENSFLLLEFAMKQISDSQRACIELFYLQQLKYEEIQQLLELDFKAVKSNIQNGKRNLKLILSEKLKEQ
jgi:RNA polymerase sigma-70 factor (ECF subfamily)